jgi:hypothetical protein
MKMTRILLIPGIRKEALPTIACNERDVERAFAAESSVTRSALLRGDGRGPRKDLSDCQPYTPKIWMMTP